MSQSTDEKVNQVTARYEREAKEAEERARRELAAQSEPDRGHDHWLQQRREQEAKKAQERALAQQQPQQLTPANQALWDAWADGRIKARFEQWFAPMFADQCEPVLKDIGEVLAKDRRVRLEEDEAVIAEVRNWVEGKLETKILPRIEALEQRVAQHIGRTDALTETITAERTARENEVRTAVAVKEWAEGRPETKLLQRLEALEQRFAQYVGQSSGRSDALAEAIAAERAARENETKAIVDDVKICVGSEFQTELAALAERLKAMPGKLPIAKIWCAESITYEGQFVSHDGALWQAREDTAKAPGGGAWLCVARAGRDAVTPQVIGTYDA